MARRSIGTRLTGAFRGRGARAVPDSAGSSLELELKELERTREVLRESHDKLIEMERLAASEELASDVADAINNPLAALLGRLQMRLEQGRSPDPEDERLYALATRIASVVQGLSQLSKRSALEAREISVADIVEGAVRSLRQQAEERGVKLSTSLEPGIPLVSGDLKLLADALSALLENAFEASADGGHVALRVEKIERACAVRFRVRDVGPGIPPDLRERVFDPFFTTRPGSLGLGLALARRIALGHGGRVRIHCGPGPGAEATLDLPLVPPPGWQAAEPRD